MVQRVGWFLVLLVLTGCTLFEPDAQQDFQVKVYPQGGHPPFEVTVVATPMEGGTYTFELPGATVKQSENRITATVDRVPWEVTVRWSSGTGVRHQETATVEIDNRPPTIWRPKIAPSPDWFFYPRERTLLDFNYTPGSMYDTPSGITDPDGDAWQIVEIKVLCSTKYMYDSIFYPPYEPGVFHASYRGQIIENACIVYPTYTGNLDEETGLPFPPNVEVGYPFDYRTDHNLTPGEMPSQKATLTVIAEDEWGARAIKNFEIDVGALDFR
jgi:hypothetical protein